MKININKEIIEVAGEVMSITEDKIKPDFENSFGNVNHNGLPQAVWARRGKEITDKFNNNKAIKIRHVHRGGIWQFEAIIDTNTRCLYLLINHENLKKLQKKFIENGYSTHYLFSLLNLNPPSQQISIFPLNLDQKNARKYDCNKILGEFSGKVDTIYAIAFDYANHTVAKGTVYLLDKAGSTIETKDISDILIPQSRSSEENSLGTDDIKKPVKETQPLVKLKKKRAKASGK